MTATRALLEATRTAFERYPIELDPCKALSPAAIAKACLRSMGVTPPMPRFKNVPDQVHGRAMVAYFGGRAEVRTRRTTVPVVTTDFLSMYPTVNALLGLWRYVVARKLQVVDVTERVRRQLDVTGRGKCTRKDARKCTTQVADEDVSFGFFTRSERLGPIPGNVEATTT